MRPLVSIVMPVRNEAAALPETLRRLAEQTYPRDRMEILIVDGQSDDETVRVARAQAPTFPCLRILSNPTRLSSSSRNLAIRESRGEIIAIIEGHCLVEPDFIECAVDLLEAHDVDCLGRPIDLIPSNPTTFARAIVAGRTAPLGHSGKSFVYREGEGPAPAMSMATVYRRRVFDTLGLFDESFDACEDLEFNWRSERAGLRTYFSDRLRVRYLARGDFRSLFRQVLRYGHGRFRYVCKHSHAADVETLILPAFSAAILALPVVALACVLLPPIAVAVLLAPYVLYVLILAAGSVATAARRGWALLPYLPGVFFTIHFGLGLGFLQAMGHAIGSVFSRRARPGGAGGAIA
ncbi:MAG: glycosyltransferase [Planctomycetes bacterium]|nr:glycosyltransferase [Planctomycetota bacterium]